MLADSEGWEQPRWYLFGQEHAAPRKSKYFDLSDVQVGFPFKHTECVCDNGLCIAVVLLCFELKV